MTLAAVSLLQSRRFVCLHPHATILSPSCPVPCPPQSPHSLPLTLARASRPPRKFIPAAVTRPTLPLNSGAITPSSRRFSVQPRLSPSDWLLSLQPSPKFAKPMARHG